MLAQRARGEEEAIITVARKEQLKSMKAKSISIHQCAILAAGALNFDVDRPASVIVLWSEIHSAFGFLENISCGMSLPRYRA